ncbi:MATE family efflux transporter [Mesorhizobium marinum]|uniref:MATE family efflux transporter n=1 Tax=Mesorhizobium marinum TaxID=3228790 RepID=UPI0034659D91
MSGARGGDFPVTHRAVLTIAVPMTIAYLSTPLVGLVSTGVIGQLGDAALLGGVAIGAVVFDVVFTSCNFLRGATTGFTAQAVGAGDRQEEHDVLLAGLGIALLLGILLVLFQGPIGVLGVSLLGADRSTASPALDYFSARVWSAPFVFINFVVFGWVLGRGEALVGLLLQTVLNAANILLSLLLVLHYDFGVAGAGWASTLAEVLTAGLSLVVVASRMPAAGWRFSELANRRRLRRLGGVNTDMMIRSLALLVGLSFFTRQSALLGADVLAANTILLRFYFVAIAMLDGVAMAAEQLAGRAVGAGFRATFDRVVRLTTVWSVLFALVTSAGIYLASDRVVAWVTPIGDIRVLASVYLPYVVALPLAGAVAFQMDGVFIGATWSREMRNMMLVSLLVYLLSWAALAPFMANHGLWLALLIFHGMRSIAFRARLETLTSRTFPVSPA